MDTSSGAIWPPWRPPSSGRRSAWKAWTSAWHQRVRKGSRDSAKPILVFTDPDGTLLEHRTHPCVPACKALRFLADQNVPVVLCSSRTRAELELIQQEFHLRHPFISESGSAVYLPRGYFASSPGPAGIPGYDVIAFGGPHQPVAEALRRTAEALLIEVRSVTDMSLQELADGSRVSLAEARLAQLREYSELFRLIASDPAVHSRLFDALRRAGLRCAHRGRFHHVSFGADIRRSVRTLTSLYRQQFGDILTVGVSDGLAEPSILCEVDVPIVVLNPAVDLARVLRKVPTARVTTAAGSLGWDQAIFAAVQTNVEAGL